MQAHDELRADRVGELASLLRGARIVALTGAGISTESGIPDYRGEGKSERKRPIHGPEFLKSAALRRRYWARAMAGWERFRRAEPNHAHFAIASLESRGIIDAVITQNVDRLHHAAGSKRVIELHGALADVLCLGCGAIEARDAIQARMRAMNPDWLSQPALIAPDGDADLSDDAITRFVAPSCEACGGDLKPRVVFFGENVPRPIVDAAFAALENADALLVCGTSLAVFSGYRFLLRARDLGKPIAIVNRGPVRGEEHARTKIEASTGATLADLARRLLAA